MVNIYIEVQQPFVRKCANLLIFRPTLRWCRCERQNKDFNFFLCFSGKRQKYIDIYILLMFLEKQ